MTEAGILYLCATPIGNLEDITPRVLRILSEADIIAAEDTRHTLQLLNHFNIKGHLVRYDEHSKDKNGPKLIAELLDGKNVALVSDAGFPGIADPGEQLAREAIDAGIKVVPLPGANAALCALIASGLPSSPFFFGGFLPKSKKNRAEQLAAWKNIPSTIILYEAPHRIKDVLKEILAAWGDRQLAAARELTKLHEEFFRGSVTECLAWLEAQPPRGEFCLVIASGLPSSPFFFGGFLPKSKKNRAEQLAAWKNIPSTIILYEAPHRIKDVLKEILAAWGDRQLAAARELTKLHEEFFRGSVTECLAWLEAQPPRGEFCLVIAQGEADVQEETQAADPLDEVKALIAQGMDKKAALAQVAKARKVPKRELYNRLLDEE